MANIVNEQEIFFNSFEPKTTNRFIMYIDGLPTYIVSAAGRPSLNQGSISIPHINVVRYVKGRSEWQPIQVTLYDPIAPSGTQAVMEWVRLHHESVTGRDGYADMYKKDIILNALGPVGEKTEEWILKGAFIENTSFGGFNFAEANLMNVQITLRYDYAILNY
jgi:hypothetical protein